RRLTDAKSGLMQALTLYITISVKATAERDILKDLRSKPRQRPPECQPGTRVEILAKCEAWSKDLDAPNILWIKAAPGAGKSAIASTLVTTLGIKKTRLGATFFFNRQETAAVTASTVWQGIAYDLARHPTIRKQLADKMNKEEIDLATPNINTIFDQLIGEPLSKIGTVSGDQSPIVVLDALDECGGLEGVRSTEFRNLIRTLAAWSDLPSSCKLIVTSREEAVIARIFTGPRTPYTIDLLIGEETINQSTKDVQAFLSQELGEITKEYSSLPVGWPGVATIETLATKAGGLFIWASTAVEYIRRGPPKENLEEMIHADITMGMSALYTKVIDTAFRDAPSKIIQESQMVLGTIVVAREILDIRTIAELLAIDLSRVEYICNALRPVLEIRKGARFRHQSFVDFLLNQQATGSALQIDTINCNQILADHCLRVMTERLRFNICEIPSSYLLNSDVLNTLSSIEDYIPSCLQYASRYWVDHLQGIPPGEETIVGIRYILKNHFLSWLEVASLCSFAHALQSILIPLIAWLKINNGGSLIPFATDMLRFTTHFIEPISSSAAHIYISALSLSPTSSEVKKNYQDRFPSGLVVCTGGYRSWSPLLLTLRGHSGIITAVTISPGGDRIASGSEDNTIRLWDAETGKQIGQSLEGHTEKVNSVAFSPDGRRIVSGANDNTVRLWDAKTGEQIGQPLQGHTDRVRSVMFSPDGCRIASGSDDETVRLWDVETGEQVDHPLRGHTNWVMSIAFSPDGRRIVSGANDKQSVAFSPDGLRVVSGSHDKTVRLWDIETGKQIGRSFEGHASFVLSVIFSPDGYRIASSSGDKTVQLWDVETGKQVGQPLVGHADPVGSIAFSPDGHRIASGSDDKTVRLWGVESGEATVQPVEGHADSVMSVAFSPDGRLIASGSGDKTVRLWDTETGKQIGEPLEGHTRSVNSVAFSLDDRRLVSGSDDQTIRLWDVETKKQTGQPFQGHTDRVWMRQYDYGTQRQASRWGSL
ncbi:related to WD40-repeat protein (notchless protein), partial [Serendipita indica DSM 11827]